MQLIFDRGTQSERTLPVDTINELVSENSLRASLNIDFKDLDDIPDTSSFYANRNFSTIDAVVEDRTIRLHGSYNYISVMNISYSQRLSQYVLSLVLEYKTPEVESR